MTNFSAKGLPAMNRPGTPDAGFEWEVLPSLAHLLVPIGADRVWEDTRPAPLEILLAPEHACQALPGLDVHEVTEPEIFRLFFDARIPGEPGARA